MMAKPKSAGDFSGLDAPHFSMDAEQKDYAAWEEVDAGRFMPRRIRGSCRGRALG